MKRTGVSVALHVLKTVEGIGQRPGLRFWTEGERAKPVCGKGDLEVLLECGVRGERVIPRPLFLRFRENIFTVHGAPTQ